MGRELQFLKCYAQRLNTKQLVKCAIALQIQ